MGKTMTPSDATMTDGQIDKATDFFRAKLRKHRHEFPVDSVQQALGQDGFANELFAVFRKFVEAIAKMIVRSVQRMDRTRTPEEIITATGSVQYVNADVLATMPCGEGDAGVMYFFKPDLSPNGLISDDDLAKEFARYDLEPDPYLQAQINADDPGFADTHPNGTHWKDADGNWNFAAFGQWHDGERGVGVFRSDGRWRDHWWFGGVRKKH